jgi:aminocarboxymuconate-semialdehyde decarboxylase
LPLPDIEGSLAELSYALDVLKLYGVVLFSNARGVYLGDARFDPIFRELERRRAVVFVHPTASPDPTAHALGLPDALLDFVVDTSRAIAHLHYSNTFARTPNIKYIFSHAGGTIPYPERAAVLGETALTLLPRIAAILRGRVAPASSAEPQDPARAASMGSP